LPSRPKAEAGIKVGTANTALAAVADFKKLRREWPAFDRVIADFLHETGRLWL
jgi:hypothetical protein